MIINFNRQLKKKIIQEFHESLYRDFNLTFEEVKENFKKQGLEINNILEDAFLRGHFAELKKVIKILKRYIFFVTTESNDTFDANKYLSHFNDLGLETRAHAEILTTLLYSMKTKRHDT